MTKLEKISPETGVGMKFINACGEECITLPRKNPTARVAITTYIGMVAWAEHFYASIHISSLDCKVIRDTSDSRFTGNVQPEESQWKRIDVSAPAKKDWYEDKEFGGKFLVLKKGTHTTRFDTIEECIDAIEYTFNQKFNSEWVIKPELCDTTWDVEKARLIEEYSRC